GSILEVIIDSMIEFTGAERGHLILREGGNNVIKATRNAALDDWGDDVGSASENQETRREEKFFSGSLVDRVLKTGEPTIPRDATTDERFSLSMSIHRLQLRSIVCLPFRVRDAVIGAIYLDNRHQRGVFTEADMDLLQSFADQAAIAIANAWAF